MKFKKNIREHASHYYTHFLIDSVRLIRKPLLIVVNIWLYSRIPIQNINIDRMKWYIIYLRHILLNTITIYSL